MWAAQRPAFGRHFTAISYDRRGFGKSTCATDAGKELDDALAAGIPNAHRSVIQGGGHLVNMTAARAFNRVVISFLNSATQSTGFKARPSL
jgi:pimeloyl-ACP methyl ester carboxylesterase